MDHHNTQAHCMAQNFNTSFQVFILHGCNTRCHAVVREVNKLTGKLDILFLTEKVNRQEPTNEMVYGLFPRTQETGQYSLSLDSNVYKKLQNSQER